MEKAAKSKEMDMLNGGIAGKLILFAIPLAFSSILQQLFNSADVAVVGRFAGDTALAAVGSCVALVGIFVNLIVGLSVGPNAALATLIGQKKREQINGMLHTILTFGAVLGLLLMCLGMLSARIILELSGTPESVMSQALLYIRIYFLSIPFMVIYNFGSASLRSFGDSRRPMYYLILSGTVNVILNLFLVICFHLGVAGVAIATVISNVLSSALAIIHLSRRPYEFQFRFRDMKIEKNALKKVLAIVFMIWDDFFVSIYTTSSAVAVYGLIRMHHVCSLEGLTATYEVESSALRGMGKSLEPSIITILGTVVFRLIWMVTVFKWIPTYDMLMNVYLASWIFTGGAIFIVYWHHMKKVSKYGIH